MIALVILGICAIVLLVLVLPFRTSRSVRSPEPDLGNEALIAREPEAIDSATPEAAVTMDRTQLEDDKDRVFQALADLRFDYEAGKLSREDFEEEDARLRSRAAVLLKELGLHNT